MFTQTKVIAWVIVFSVFMAIGWYVKSLNDQVVTCEANTKIQKDRYDRNIKNYEDIIEDIGEFFSVKIEEVDNFERTSNETDCQATMRFFDRANY